MKKTPLHKPSYDGKSKYWQVIAGKNINSNIYHGKYRGNTGHTKKHPFKLEGVFNFIYQNARKRRIGNWAHFKRIDDSHAICELCYTKVTYTVFKDGCWKGYYEKIVNEEDGQPHRVFIKGAITCKVPPSKLVKPKRRTIKVRHDPEPSLRIVD